MTPANSLDSATYGHGVSELVASCNCYCGCASCRSCGFIPDESDDA